MKAKTILIVEDELAYMQLLQTELKARGYEVLAAKDGRVGLNVALRKHPDLILLDLLMPVMDGLTMLEDLREEDQYGAKVPIILLTNVEPDPKIITGTIKSQPSYYLIKSDIKMEELFQKMDELLGQTDSIKKAA